MALTIVAIITARSGHEDLVRTELEKLVEPTRAEPGCIQYDLHCDNDDPAHFLFFENWETRDLWQAHMDSAHIASYRAGTEDAVADFQLYEMTKTA